MPATFGRCVFFLEVVYSRAVAAAAFCLLPAYLCSHQGTCENEKLRIVKLSKSNSLRHLLTQICNILLLLHSVTVLCILPSQVSHQTKIVEGIVLSQLAMKIAQQKNTQLTKAQQQRFVWCLDLFQTDPLVLLLQTSKEKSCFFFGLLLLSFVLGIHQGEHFITQGNRE